MVMLKKKKVKQKNWQTGISLEVPDRPSLGTSTGSNPSEESLKQRSPLKKQSGLSQGDLAKSRSKTVSG